MKPAASASHLRQNAFHYDVPVSGIDQLLYTWMPDLIFSPPPLQRIARAQFRNMLALGAILVSALIAVFGVSHPGQRGLVFMLYCVLGVWILIRALRRDGGSTELSVPALIALAVAAASLARWRWECCCPQTFLHLSA